MIERLIIDFFSKIEKNESITKNHGKAVFFIQELLEKKHGKFNYMEKKKAIRLQEKYIDKKENVNAKTDSFLRDVMAQYLDYENYQEYIANHSKSLPLAKVNKNSHEQAIKQGLFIPPPQIKWYKKYTNEITIIIPLVLLFFFSAHVYRNNYAINENRIIWKETYYEKSSCLKKNVINNNKYFINIKRFKNVLVTDSTIFFKKEKAIIWHGKNKKEVREFFYDRGIHPETFKELKPVIRTALNSEQLLME